MKTYLGCFTCTPHGDITCNNSIIGVCPMTKHPVQPYKGLSPCTAVAKTGAPRGKTTAEKPPENYHKVTQRVPHSTTYLKEQTILEPQ